MTETASPASRTPRPGRLRRSDPSSPGLRRERRGGAFVYLDAEGQVVADPDTLARIEALVIPPAWRDVWISPWPNGHLQAVGTDAAGRRQYLYHDRWRARRDRQKFDRMLDFAERLPDLREQVTRELSGRGLTRVRVLAAAIRLLDRGFLRIGGQAYAQHNGSFGLATLRKEHVGFGKQGRITLDFVGKSGVSQYQTVYDPLAQGVLRSLKRRKGGGQELLAYREGDGSWRDVRADEINAHLKARIGDQFSAKDFRTWHATVLAATALAVSVRVARSKTGSKRAIARAISETATYLGNTPAVCRNSYIDPRVIDRYRGGQTILKALSEEGRADLSDPWAEREVVEAAVLDLLRDKRSGSDAALRALVETR